jgi:hypothetical protein
MATALSSWKEIAHYVGKGVRTVQRWEREAGLPVRREHGEGKGKVLAFPEEIDGWMHSAFTQNSDGAGSELFQLRNRVEELLAENRELRRALNIATRSFAKPLPSSGSSDEPLLIRCNRLLRESAQTRQQFAQLVATQSVVSQACADTMQTLKDIHAYQPTDLSLPGAD